MCIHLEPYFSPAQQLLDNRNNRSKKITYAKKRAWHLPDISDNDWDLLLKRSTKNAQFGMYWQRNENQISYKFASLLPQPGLMVSEQSTYLVFTLRNGEKYLALHWTEVSMAKFLHKRYHHLIIDLNYYDNSDPLKRASSVISSWFTWEQFAGKLSPCLPDAHQETLTLDRYAYRLSGIVDDTNQLRTTLRGFGHPVSWKQ